MTRRLDGDRDIMRQCVQELVGAEPRRRSRGEQDGDNFQALSFVT